MLNYDEELIFEMSDIEDREFLKEQIERSDSESSEPEEKLTFEQALKQLSAPGAQPMQEVGDYFVFKRIMPGEIKPQYYAIDHGINGVANTDGEFGVLLKTYVLDPTLGNNQNLKTQYPFVAKKPKGRDADAFNMAKNEGLLTPSVIENSFAIEIEGLPFLIMPRFNGKEIFDAVNQLAYDKDERKKTTFINRLLVATEIFKQLCEKCHFPQNEELNPIIHKDIKPENVMIAMHLLNLTFKEARNEYQTQIKKKRAQIIDFGLAEEVTLEARQNPRKNSTLVETSSEEKSGHTMSGSLLYASPELTLRNQLSLNSDMYSLAAVMLLIFGSTSMQYPKNALSWHKNRLQVNEKKAHRNAVKKMNNCGITVQFYKGLPAAILSISEYAKKYSIKPLPAEDPLFRGLLTKDLKKKASKVMPTSIRTFCQVLSLGGFKFNILSKPMVLESLIRKSIRNAMSKIHANWLNKNKKDLFVKTANAGFGDKDLFEDTDVPQVFTEKHRELLASLPVKKEREKYSGSILGVFHFLLNRMQDKDMEKRPSSRQMMHFCQIMLSLCLATPSQKMMHQKDRINQLHEIAIDVLHSRETNIVELKRDKNLPPSLSLSRATTESPSSRSELESPLGSCGGFPNSPTSESSSGFSGIFSRKHVKGSSSMSVLDRLISPISASPKCIPKKKGGSINTEVGTIFNFSPEKTRKPTNLEKGSLKTP